MAIRRTHFDLGDPSGDYWQELLRLDHRRGRWQFGGWWSLVQLDMDGEQRNGSTNPTLFVERRNWEGSSGWSLALGTQLELPLGSDEPAIRSDHAELLPYVGLGFARSVFETRMVFGLRESLVGDDAADPLSKHGGESHGELLVVAPHAGSELVGRAALSMRLADDALRLQLALDGQRVTEAAVRPDQFQNLSLRLDWRAFADWTFSPSVELALGGDRRFENAFGLGLRRAF